MHFYIINREEYCFSPVLICARIWHDFMAKVEICAKEKERKLARLWKTSICLGDRKLRQAHNAIVRSMTMSCDRQKVKAEEEVDEKNIEERLATIGKNDGGEEEERE